MQFLYVDLASNCFTCNFFTLPWNLLFDDWVFAFSFSINLSQFSVLTFARIWKWFGDLNDLLLVLDEFRFSLFDMFTNSPCDGRCLSIFSVKTLIISVLFLLYSLRYFNWSLSSLISDSLLLNGFALFQTPCWGKTCWDYFSTAWFGLARLCFRRRKYSRAEKTLLMISNQR